MKIIIMAISFAVLSVPLYPGFSPGSSGQACLLWGAAVASAQVQQDGQSKMIRPTPASPIRKIQPAKPVIDPAARPVISPGKTQPQPGQQQPGQSQETVQQPQYQQGQPIQQADQSLPYTDTTTTYQSYQDQNIYSAQGNIYAPDTSSNTSECLTGVQTDMYRRTGGQGRTNVPGQQIQQMPMMQQMPVQQDPQGMQQVMPQQMPMMQQPGMFGSCTIRLSEDRSSIALLDGSGQEINHIALGRDRVQKIFKSPDGNWNVLVFKVRQRQEYGAIAVNMAQCDPQEAREIRSLPDNIEFQADEMLLMFPGNIVERLSLIHKTGP